MSVGVAGREDRSSGAHACSASPTAASASGPIEVAANARDRAVADVEGHAQGGVDGRTAAQPAALEPTEQQNEAVPLQVAPRASRGSSPRHRRGVVEVSGHPVGPRKLCPSIAIIEGNHSKSLAVSAAKRSTSRALKASTACSTMVRLLWGMASSLWVEPLILLARRIVPARSGRRRPPSRRAGPGPRDPSARSDDVVSNLRAGATFLYLRAGEPPVSAARYPVRGEVWPRPPKGLAFPAPPSSPQEKGRAEATVFTSAPAPGTKGGIVPWASPQGPTPL